MKAGKAKTRKSSQFCPMCGSALRSGAVFCHRCGRPLPDKSAVIYEPKESKNIAATTHEVSSVETFETPGNVADSRETTAPEAIGNDKITSNQNNLSSERGLERESAPETAFAGNIENTAPPLPKPRRVVKTTEYVWDESGTDPTLRFVLFTVITVVFAIVIFWLARFINF